MKKRMEKDWIFLFGLAALMLRRQLYLTAMDEKGLLLRNHPLSLGLLALTVATFLLIAWKVRKPELMEESGFVSALGHGVMALGILATVRHGVPEVGYLGILWRWLGLASPLCLLAAGAAAAVRKQPFFLLHMVPSLFFVVHIVCYYQTWSGDPQMQNYLFALLSTMALALFAFYTAAAEADCGNDRLRTAMGQAAVYLCLAELANSGNPVLYLAGFVWARAEMYRFRVTPGEEKD